MPTSRVTLGELAAWVEGEVLGDPALEIIGVREVGDGAPGAIVYAADAKALRVAEAGEASAVLVPRGLEPRKPAIRAADARLAFARLVARFAPPPPRPAGIHPTALLGADVALGDEVAIGPYVVVGDRARVGDGTTILAGSVIGDDAAIGRSCYIHPLVSIGPGTIVGDRVILYAGVVLGSDGFGYASTERGHVKIPHLGRVVVEDDVEIGANTAVDRATLGETRIGRGTKIDNLVQIGHNVRIGRAALIVGQVGLAGSVTVGDGAILAGQAGIPDHVTVGAGARVLARAVPTKDVPAGDTVLGFPAQAYRDELRVQAALRRLPFLLEALETLQRRVAELEAGRPSGGSPAAPGAPHGGGAPPRAGGA